MLHYAAGCDVANNRGAFETSVAVDGSQLDDPRGCGVSCLARCGGVFTVGGGGRLEQCFSTAGPWPGTDPWHQLYRAARGLRKLQYATRFH